MRSPASVRKTFKYKLSPTPATVQALEFVLRRCRELYNAALQERRDAWRKCGVSVTFAMQSAQLPGVKEVRPEYQDINAQVLQEVLHRLDKTYHAFFRRVQAGEGPRYPRFQGRHPYHSLTSPPGGGPRGPRLPTGDLAPPHIRRLAARRLAAFDATPHTT